MAIELTVEHQLHELVRQATCANRRVKRGVVSQRDFAELWHTARAGGMNHAGKSVPTEMHFSYYRGTVRIIVQPSVFCPDGRAGVA